MSIRDTAIRELELLGYTTNINSRQYNEMNAHMAENVLELLEVFSNQGHSGSSAPYCISLFTALANHKPLTPLTGDDNEWNDVSTLGTEPCYQNNRCSNVFKNSDGRAYDINGKIFKNQDGVCFTNRDSKVYIEFPYTPHTEYVDVIDNNECNE
jgi:hypothetical protein